MSNDRELELLHRRDEILRETMDLTSHVVQSLEQQQKFAVDTKENLHQQNLILAAANDKMHSMNQDLNSVVSEMNQIEAHHGCLCCRLRRKKRGRAPRAIDSKPLALPDSNKALEPAKDSSAIPELVDNNEQEKKIVQELNQMKDQFLVFQRQVQTINKSFDEGEQIIHQLGNETNQYMNASAYCR